jgi:hypothetical protein
MNGSFNILISLDECSEIVRKLDQSEANEVKVLDYDVTSYCDGYPGFLGDYLALKVKFCDVRK